ncbi:LuxR C-terminal-related transcriptional regulator [Nocardioides sp. GCM10027113]|uniref:LuxR C-terminal-related transcriptional regulator n=1 Tax=unclassified Nocardioides TaxID=2615069 RepID=UPI0036122AE3
MGVVDELLQARQDFERRDWAGAFGTWSGVDPDELDDADLRAAAMTAFLVGHRDESVAAYQHLFNRCQARGDTTAAIRVAFHTSMTLATGGEGSLAAGWTARAVRLLEGLEASDGDPVEAGYVAFLRMFAHLGAGQFMEAADQAVTATSIGMRHDDQDLIALGLCAQGRMAIYGGRVADGVALLDESMACASAGTATGAVTPMICGHVYCTAIEGCQEIGDFGRVAEWTSALQRWCAEQPGLLAFTGQCAVHRGQVMRLRGAWTAALEELELAIDRYRRSDARPAVGLAEYERGELLRLRGDLDAAESAYARADEHGLDPQPGLALLWLAQGRGTAAAGAVRRLLAEPGSPVHRSALLPAAVDVLLAEGQVDEARAASVELDQVAAAVGSASLQARAAYAAAAVEVAAGDAAGALPYLRKCRQLWSGLDCPYEVARAHALAGRALAAVGDDESARREREAALAGFTELGAVVDARAVSAEITPGGLPGGLTAREAEVLRLVASGHSNARIAEALTLSEKTVARHLSNIFTKLDVGSRTAAAAYAYEQGLV